MCGTRLGELALGLGSGRTEGRRQPHAFAGSAGACKHLLINLSGQRYRRRSPGWCVLRSAPDAILVVAVEYSQSVMLG
jgi:hypothetical protein